MIDESLFDQMYGLVVGSLVTFYWATEFSHLILLFCGFIIGNFISKAIIRLSKLARKEVKK